MPGLHGYTAAPPTLAAFQLSYNGLLLGDGTDYDVSAIEGIDSMAAVQQNDVARERDYGQFQGAYYSGGREITLTMEVHSTSDAGLRSDLDALFLAFAPQPLNEIPLFLGLPGMAQVARMVFCRVIDRIVVVDVNYVYHRAAVVMRLWATDPRVYDATQQSASTTLPASTGGTAWPITWPLSWGTASGSGTVSCLNAGSFGTKPIVTVTGPTDNVTVTNQTTGLYITVLIALAAGDVLTLDFLNRTVLLNGTGNRRKNMTNDSTWFDLVPGANTVTYRANTVQAGGAMTIYWNSAWN